MGRKTVPDLLIFLSTDPVIFSGLPVCAMTNRWSRLRLLHKNIFRDSNVDIHHRFFPSSSRSLLSSLPSFFSKDNLLIFRILDACRNGTLDVYINFSSIFPGVRGAPVTFYSFVFLLTLSTWFGPAIAFADIVSEAKLLTHI